MGAVLSACGGGDGGGADGGGGEDAGEDRDAGEDGDASGGCTSDDDCDDGRYCNGTETCSPDDDTASPLGCVAGEAPCGDGETCDEEADSCGACSEEPDADGDGARAASCGGDDCDDTDPSVYPGGTETCDSAGVDEDCDPSTLGDDADGDGYVDSDCCNEQDDASLLCGRDCDDGSSDVNPETTDICGNGDQDCDTEIDEEPDEVYYRDDDGDGYGVATDVMMACGAPEGYALLGTDCNDDDSDVNPGVEELCDDGLVDENCDGMANDGCECTTGDTQVCGTTDVGACRYGTQTCILDGDGRSIWGACTDAIEPTGETCNGEDDDCNGTVDDLTDAQCMFGETSTGTNMCGHEGSRSCDSSTCRWSPQEFSVAETVSTCDYCDDTAMGFGAEVAVATATDSTALPTTSDPSSTTSAYYAGPLDIGYATIVFNAEVRAFDDSAIGETPDEIGHGWAMVVAKEDTTSPNPLEGDAGWRLGVPWGRDGFSVEWRFYDVDGTPADETDSLLMRQITDGAPDPEVERATSVAPPHDGSTSITDTEQQMRITIQPDLPGDGTNDTQVVVEYFSGYPLEPTEALACGGTEPDCPFTIATGESYHFGVTFSMLENNKFHIRSGSIEREGLCP